MKKEIHRTFHVASAYLEKKRKVNNQIPIDLVLFAFSPWARFTMEIQISYQWRFSNQHPAKFVLLLFNFFLNDKWCDNDI